MERLKDKVFDLWAVQIEVIFEMEEDVEISLSVSSVLLLLLLRIDCFMIVDNGGGRGGGCR